MLELAFAA
ncbi:hypothetical protein YPPY48_2184, partial [Yersinia pestis PY-48]